MTYHWHDDEPGWCPCDEDNGGAVVLNPSAIGNPDETPQVWLGADLRAALGDEHGRAGTGVPPAREIAAEGRTSERGESA